MKKFLKDQVFNWAIGLILGFISGGYAGYCWLVPRLLLSPVNDSTVYAPSEDNSLGSVVEYLMCTFFGSGIGATGGALLGAVLLQIIGASTSTEQRDEPLN